MTSTTSPETGAIDVGDALRDSTTPNGSSFVTVAPTAGSSTNTMSPSVVLREVGDADRRPASPSTTHPLVLFRVPEIRRKLHAILPLPAGDRTARATTSRRLPSPANLDRQRRCPAPRPAARRSPARCLAEGRRFGAAGHDARRAPSAVQDAIAMARERRLRPSRSRRGAGARPRLLPRRAPRGR